MEAKKMTSIEKELFNLRANVNQEFLILTAFWIISMQIGFSFLEAGSVRSKNTTNILFKNLIDMFLGALVYWGIGYPFAHGNPGNGFIGYNFFFSSHIRFEELAKDVKDLSQNSTYAFSAGNYFASLFSSYGYATVASTITSGAMAERLRLSSYLVFSTMLTGFVYPVVSHWVWDERGWLSSFQGLTFVDHAGSAVVHVTGGTAALVGAVILGPRLGRFTNNENALHSEDGKMRGHSIPLTNLGGFMLSIGFLAFNVASQLHITEPGDGIFVSLTVMNSMLSASAGALSAVVLKAFVNFKRKKTAFWSIITLINGSLSGFVAICAASNQVMNWAAALTGVLAGISTVMWEIVLERFQVDDPVTAIPVHLGGGLTGSLSAPVWSAWIQRPNGSYMTGIIYGGGKEAFMVMGWNVLGTACIILWTGFFPVSLLLILKKVKVLRVSPQHEKIGLDLVYHGEPAYPKSANLPIRKMINYDF